MKVHFIAIGGSVMHQLAIALKKKGYGVTGSDDEIFEPARSNLAEAGILPLVDGWFPEKIVPSLDALILGMHARGDNPELLKAIELGLKIYSFPEYIYQESLNKTRVVIGGSHGKTTTTAMIMHVLLTEGREFDWLVGAKLAGFSQSVNITDAPLIICEGDEYPASPLEKKPKFHFLFPHMAVLTGIAWDHINVFPSFDLYLQQFSIFIDKIEPGGTLIYNQTDPVLRELVEHHPSPVHKVGYGLPPHHIDHGQTVLDLDGIPTRLAVFGEHNLLNLHAAWTVCQTLGIDSRGFLQAIANFSGAAKRLELLGQNQHTLIYRDFAHAPSKVKASMEAVRYQYPERRLISVLELHTFSSLNEGFMSQYAGTMDSADLAVVFYSRHALELKRMPALSNEKVKAGFARKGLIVFNERTELEKWLQIQSYENANLLLMSSGNYDGLDLSALIQKITHIID